MTRRVVVSAVNFTEGGPLTVLRDCLRAAAVHLPPDWEIIALVHDRALVDEPRVKLVEVPDAKRSWLRRLRHEWFGFGRLSRDWAPDLWLSLHDVTPRVQARRQAVYCHNPAPFYALPWREARMEPALFVFNRLYRHFYGAFIHRNSWVVVQQEWIRDEFLHLFGPLQVVVAHPAVHLDAPPATEAAPTSGKVVFLYPALPRVFKNFETVLAAARQLEARGVVGFELRITLGGDENAYSRWLHRAYFDVAAVKFIGRQNREQMAVQYREATAILFPSKLETWGLPISEAKAWNKPLLTVDLPYAHETVGTYDRVAFLPATDSAAWADAMSAVIGGGWCPTGAVRADPVPPFVNDWSQLWQLLTEGL